MSGRERGSDLAMSLFLVRASNRPRAELMREAQATPDPTRPRAGRISELALSLCLAEAYPAARSHSTNPRAALRRSGTNLKG